MRQLAIESGEPSVLDVSPSNVAAYRRGGVALIMKDLKVSGLPQHVVEYFGQLLIARGADQAFRTKMELVNFKKVAQHFQKQLEEIESNLSVFAAIAYCDPSNPEAADKEARKHAAKLAKELDECRGCLHAVRETRTWTAAICKVPRFPSTSRLFVASDAQISLLPPEMTAPGGLMRRVSDFSRTVEESTDKTMAVIARHGWPPSYTRTEGTEGKHKCRHCEGMFGGKWVRAMSCWKCRFELRLGGKCPYASFDNGRYCLVCPHQHKCLRCEQVSCSACKVLHSSDLEEGVRGLVGELQPKWVFLDLDQTLSESKSGAVPVIGKHGMNPELVDMARSRREGIMVITKQNIGNKQAIEAFLSAAGLGHVPVTCLGGQSGREKKTKADVMRALLSEAQSVTAGKEESVPAGKEEEGACVGLFVDDDAREVLASALSDLPLLRVLFVSSSWEVRPALSAAGVTV